jgi:phage-related holin
MAQAPDYNRLRKMTKIYLVIQVFLVILLVFMALNFQAKMLAEGVSQRFLHSVVAAVMIQLALFYPIKRFAGNEAEREIEALTPGLDAARVKSLRTRRMIADVAKMGVFVFFVTFVARAPKVLFIQSLIFFTFILTFLTYFQCLGFALKKGIPPKE